MALPVNVARAVFIGALVFLLLPTPWGSPSLALLMGVAFGLLFTHPWPSRARSVAKTLLQVSVVALGFNMQLVEVMRAGASGFLYTLGGIAFAMALGHVLGRVMGVEQRPAYLITVGTAICGGSAIAAVGPVVEAKDEEMSVALGTVFILNAIGLLVFPVLGTWLALSEPQFGAWAALAIHDTSSVVGASARYGATALAVATTMKLARALWIVPLTLVTAALRGRRGTKIAWPWFIGFFVLAAVCNSYVSVGAPLYPLLGQAGRLGLTITLFLIGSGMSRASLARVGVRPLVLGVVLWVIVAAASLALIRAGLVDVG